MQRDARQQAFALTEVVQRRAHFSYSDSAEMLSGNSDLNENCVNVWNRRKRSVPALVKRCADTQRS